MAQPVLEQSLLTGEVRGIRALKVSGDRLYAGHSTGITVLDLTTMRVIETYHQLAAADSVRNDQVMSVDIVGGMLYAGTESGLSHASLSDNLLLPGSWNRISGAPFDSVVSMAEFGGDIYIVTSNRAMRRVQEGIWTPVGPDTTTHSIVVFDGALWAATDDGLYLTTDGGTWTRSPAAGVPLHALSAVEGHMLVAAGYDGTFRIASRSATTAEKIPGVDSPPTNSFADLAIDSSGAVWVAPRTLGTGVFRLKDGSWRHYEQGTYGLPSVVDASGYASVAVDSRNRIWVGTWGQGIAILDPSTEPPTVQWLRSSNTPLVGLSDADFFVVVSDLLADDAGHMWASVMHSLAYLITADYPETTTPFTQLFRPYLEGSVISSKLGVTSLALDNNGVLWVGGQNFGGRASAGVLLYDTGNTPDDTSDDQFVGTIEEKSETTVGLLSADVYCMTTDADGDVWVGTTGGLTRFHGTYDRAANNYALSTTHYTVNNNLPSSMIQALCADAYGYVWVGTASGLARINPSGAVEVMDAARLIDPSGDVTALAYDEERGYVWIGTPRGLNRYEAYTPRSGGAVSAQPVANPFHIGLTLQGSDYVLSGDPLTIQVTPRARVRIYTVLGELVWEDTDEGVGQVRWDGRTRDGSQIVASGIYLYVAELDGNHSHGKIAVIRDAR